MMFDLLNKWTHGQTGRLADRIVDFQESLQIYAAYHRVRLCPSSRECVDEK